MKLRVPLPTPLLGAAGTAGICSWLRTLDCRVALYDPTADPSNSACTTHGIYLLWHEYIPMGMYLQAHNNVTMLISRHRDANILPFVANRMGFDVVRGSTFHGGSAALRELVRKSRKGHLGLTPDGPRGPRRVMSQGPIYLASKLRMPLIAMGFGYDRPWRLRSWDRFAIPRPFSRARMILSPAVNIPPNLDRDGIEHYRGEMERLLDRLTVESEAWAESGTPKTGQQRPTRRTASYRRALTRKQAVIGGRRTGRSLSHPNRARPAA